MSTETAETLVPWLLFICNACGYIYNEEEGDPDSGLLPGTRFTDIPDDWACPLCGVTKSDFEPYQPPNLDELRARAKENALAGIGKTRANPGVVIVGAGRAGWQLAETLRSVDDNLPITIVSACSGDVYDKPLLSVAMARNFTLETLVKESGVKAAERLSVRLLPHTHAIRICKETRQLRTTRCTVSYDYLVLAHGAQAVVLVTTLNVLAYQSSGGLSSTAQSIGGHVERCVDCWCRINWQRIGERSCSWWASDNNVGYAARAFSSMERR